MKIAYLGGLLLLMLAACNSDRVGTSGDLVIPFEKYELENGLDVILSVDRSDPVVAVVLNMHVGSAREKEGRTGFAHLFEHLLFNESENLGRGGLDALSARVGGSGANGSTSRDRTNYFQTVPKDALEKMLWAEADKLGWFINTVTEPVLEKEKQVVKNEKRQSYDNRPYGHTSYVITKNLYPAGHPYSWDVIGSMEDIQHSELRDVQEFYGRWYVPNNATLVISGDIDPEQTREWVEKYFGEIKKGDEITPVDVQPVQLDRTVRLFHEDNFANLPELNLTWPTTPLYHPDSYALEILASYLSQRKKSPLNKILVDQEKLTSQVRVRAQTSELAGQMTLTVRAFDGVDLDTIMEALQNGFAVFEEEGISEQDLEGIRAMQEYGFYSGLSSVLGKGIQLANYNVLAGDPGYFRQDLSNLLSVTTEDVMRVYEEYIRGRHYIATSFVPGGETELVLDGSERAAVEEEQIDPDEQYTFDTSEQSEYEHTPSAIDRSIEPPYGVSPEITVPAIWEEELANGLRIYGIESSEVPLVHLEILLDGGQLTDDPEKGGTVNLVSRLMTRGTRERTAEELEEALQQLGASINITAQKEYIDIAVNTLARNYESTIDLLEEILLEPRWDQEEFDLLKKSTQDQIQQQMANPAAIARNVFDELIYGNNHIKSNNILGSESSVNSITLNNLKDYYDHYFTPGSATIFIVGARNKDRVVASLASLEERWNGDKAVVPVYMMPDPPEHSTVYFYDVPNATQSVLMIGRSALAATDADYYPATVMNYKLGGGGFASAFMQELRQNKGYTYGISSGFSGTTEKGPFTISTSVQSRVTLEACQLIRQIMEDYGNGFSEEDLATTKSYMIKSSARAFESAGAKLNMLENIDRYGWEHDYINERKAIVQGISIERIRELSEEYADPGKMIWLVVGDRATQIERMKELGYGEPVLISD